MSVKVPYSFPSMWKTRTEIECDVWGPGALVSDAMVACVQDAGEDGAGSEGGIPGAACVNIQPIAWCFLVNFPRLENKSKISFNTFRIRLHCSGL